MLTVESELRRMNHCPLEGLKTAVSVLPSPSKSPGIKVSVAAPQFTTNAPLPPDFDAYQFPSLGRNTEKSVFPSPSKSARGDLEDKLVEHTFKVGVMVRLQPPEMDPISSGNESTIYRLHTPFGSDEPNTDPNVAFPFGCARL
jgi:hypothetical protein